MSLAQEIVDDLENLQKNLSYASDYLSFCKISEVIKEKRTQEKALPKLESHRMINLHDYISYTQLHVSYKQARKVIKNFELNEVLDTNSFCYLMFNTYRIPGEEINSIIYQISLCEKQRINDMDKIVQQITIAWIIFVVSIYILIVIFFFHLNKRINTIWNLYFKKLSALLPSVKGILINRLSSTHNFIYIEEDRISAKRTSIKFNYWIKYALTTIILVLIAVTISLLFSYVFNYNINQSLVYRKNFIEIPLNRRTSIIRMPFTTIGRLTSNYPLRKICLNYTNFRDQTSEYLVVQNELIRLRKRFYEHEIYSNVPDESWKIIFANFQSDFNFIKLGITSAMAYLRFENFLYWNNQNIYSLANITKFINDCYEMSLCFSEILDKADTATEQVIKENFKNLIIYSVFAMLFVIGVSCVLYLAFFKKEIRLVMCIENSLATLVENESLNTK